MNFRSMRGTAILFTIIVRSKFSDPRLRAVARSFLSRMKGAVNVAQARPLNNILNDPRKTWRKLFSRYSPICNRRSPQPISWTTFIG